jgi:hypothetical protein
VQLFAANLTAELLSAAVKLDDCQTVTFDIPAWAHITLPLG